MILSNILYSKHKKVISRDDTKKSDLTIFSFISYLFQDLGFIRVEGKVFNYQTWMVKIELDHRLVTTRILQRSYTDTTLFNFKIQLVEIEKRIAVHKYCSRKGLVAIEHIFGLQQELGETMSVEITSSCVQRSPLGCSLFLKNHLFLMDIKPRPSFTDR